MIFLPIKKKPGWGSKPIIKTFFNGQHNFFWCPFCRRTHHHGIGEGSRASHCMFWDSPLRCSYKLKHFSKKELNEIKVAIEFMLKSKNGYWRTEND